MMAGDGYLAVIAVRPRPASKRRRRFRPALGRTATLPSVTVRSDPGRTGRLTSLRTGAGPGCAKGGTCENAYKYIRDLPAMNTHWNRTSLRNYGAITSYRSRYLLICSKLTITLAPGVCIHRRCHVNHGAYTGAWRYCQFMPSLAVQVGTGKYMQSSPVPGGAYKPGGFATLMLGLCWH
jgi:hypothetical protein